MCFCIKSQVKKDQLKKKSVRKGMLLVDESLCPETAWEFEAEVVILHTATTIRPNYEPVIHCGVIRQAAKVISINSEVLRSGDKGLVKFRFMFSPELIHPGSTILFREGRTKGLGVISRVIFNN